MVGIAAAEVDHINLLVSSRAGCCRSVSRPANLFACTVNSCLKQALPGQARRTRRLPLGRRRHGKVCQLHTRLSTAILAPCLPHIRVRGMQ